MKISTILLMFVFLHTGAAEVYSQKAIVTIHADNAILSDVLDEMERQTDYLFFYNKKNINASKRVSVHAKDAPVSDVLDKTLDADIVYAMVNDHVILSKRENLEKDKTLAAVLQQTIAVTGTVVDERGEPVAGANIMEKGIVNGTVTDVDGKFHLNVPPKATLVVSFIGYVTQEVAIGNQTHLNITLKEDSKLLDEVVVVGYGTQKKVNLTGSVATINSADIQGVPSSNLSNALSGRLAGVSISGSDGGRPGNTSSISIRAKGSWNNTDPLYVIDGVVRDKFAFDGLDANDVENLSILKDASAAIYGSRAANGVVLVTTKKGKEGKPVISYTGSVGTTGITQMATYMNAYDQALFINDALRTSGQDENASTWYADDELEYYKTHNYNWYDEAHRDPILTQHSVNVSGGNNYVRYYVGGNYYNETGAFDNMNYRKYALRANIEANITKDLMVTMGLTSDNRDDLKPYWRNDGGNDTLMDLWNLMLVYSSSFFPAYVDGKPIGKSGYLNQHPMEVISPETGYIRRRYSNTEANIALSYNVPFVKGLNLKVLYDNYGRQAFTKEFDVPYKIYEPRTGGTHNNIVYPELTGESYWASNVNDLLNERYDRDNSYQFNAFINYNNRFGDHEVGAVLLYEQSEGTADWFRAQTKFFQTYTLDQLNAGSQSPADFSVQGSGTENGRQSYAGRLNYGYADKYLLELSARYDGSVRFAPSERWGFFPSATAAWRISEENFFKENVRFINYLKLRASAGLMGNDAVGGWQWMQEYTFDKGAEYASSANGLKPGVIANPYITWEKSMNYNFGLDAGFLQNRLTASLNGWFKHTYDILGSRVSTLPDTFGGNMPAENYGVVDSKGYEIELAYTDQIDNITYRVGGNLGYGVNKVVTKDQAENIRAYQSEIGYSTDRSMGFIFTDIIRTQADLDALPAGYTINGETPKLGMLNYKDLRGEPGTDNPDQPDGKITGADNDFIINHMTAPVSYGFFIGATWKNWNLDLFFQGVANNQIMDRLRLTRGTTRVTKPYGFWTDHWTPENTDAQYPRVEPGTWYIYPESSFWVYDGSFLRLKNVNLSYTLPKSMLAKAGIGQAKIFFNGTNLFLLEDHVKHFDPELGDTNTSPTPNAENIRRYPPTKSYSLGINLSF
ncbi:MAG: TonB-dependent receptor [Tannerella sp.]|nr:TonB-dependent receptor [Tannerella sp.]